MLQVLYAGLVLGTLLFISKFAVFFFLPWLKAIANFNGLTMFLTDLGMGALAAKTLSIADGTIALATAITFGFLSVTVLMFKVAWKRASRRVSDWL